MISTVMVFLISQVGPEEDAPYNNLIYNPFSSQMEVKNMCRKKAEITVSCPSFPQSTGGLGQQPRLLSDMGLGSTSMLLD